MDAGIVVVIVVAIVAVGLIFFAISKSRAKAKYETRRQIDDGETDMLITRVDETKNKK
jgi:flagellar basal body-associated protein FliL